MFLSSNFAFFGVLRFVKFFEFVSSKLWSPCQVSESRYVFGNVTFFIFVQDMSVRLLLHYLNTTLATRCYRAWAGLRVRAWDQAALEYVNQ